MIINNRYTAGNVPFLLDRVFLLNICCFFAVPPPPKPIDVKCAGNVKIVGALFHMRTALVRI
jgi:hypothetical protein